MIDNIAPILCGIVMFLSCMGITVLYRDFNKKIEEEEIEENE